MQTESRKINLRRSLPLLVMRNEMTMKALDPHELSNHGRIECHSTFEAQELRLGGIGMLNTTLQELRL